MVTEFRLPELGEDIESGDVIKIIVSVGDTVIQDQPIMELETEKAAIEVPAPVAGVVKAIYVSEGEKVEIGQLLFTIDEGAEAEGKEEVEVKAKKQEKKEEKIEAKKQEEEEQAEVRASEEEKEAKERKEEEKKEKVEVKAEEEAKPKAKKEKAKTREEKEEKLEEEKTVETKAEAREQKEEKGEVVEFSRPAKTAAESKPFGEFAPASPSVRRLAREIGVDITEVLGSGPGGRISEEDVKNYASRLLITKTSGVEPIDQPKVVSLPDFAQWGEVERKPMTNVRRKTAQHLSRAWTAPHVTQHDKADITNLEKLRKEFGKKAEEAGGKLTVTAIIIKVIASALKVFPQFNASVDMASEEIIYKKYYHIGVAVDTDRGLLVPVIQDVDKKNILELSVELSQVSEKARNKKITLEEMKGGTFTITNLGGIGGTFFTPILNFPEVAILGVSRSNTEPVFINGQFEPRLMLPLSLSYDHRVIDGADAVRFLRWIIEALEEPFKLIIEG